MFLYLVPLFFVLFSFVNASASLMERNEVVSLENGRTLIVSKLEPNPGSNKWIIEIPGVSTDFHKASSSIYTRRYNALLERGFNLAVINKPGIQLNTSFVNRDPSPLEPLGADSSFGQDSDFDFDSMPFEMETKMDRRAFEDSFRHDLRLADAGTALKMAFPATSEFFAVGTSEAAYYLPELALNESRIKALVLLAGGTRRWLDEEVAKEPPKNRKRVAKQVSKVRKMNPLSQAPWTYYSIATWRSYDAIKTVPSLALLKIPVLAMHSLDDDVIDVRGALSDLQQLSAKKSSKLSLITFIEGGHGLSGHMSRTSFYINNLFYNPATGLQLAVQMDRPRCSSVFETFQYIIN